MIRSKSKFWSLLLVMVLVLAACGGGSDDAAEEAEEAERDEAGENQDDQKGVFSVKHEFDGDDHQDGIADSKGVGFKLPKTAGVGDGEVHRLPDELG